QTMEWNSCSPSGGSIHGDEIVTKRAVIFMAFILMTPLLLHAKPKQRTYNNSPDQVFQAALRTARERHVVTYVDDKHYMLTFESGTSWASYGFNANASVEAEGDGKATLII